MAIQQTKKQSDLEKRLQMLRRQVYGKDQLVSYQANKPSSSPDNSIAKSLNGSLANTASDLNYLHRDLLKILILSSLAIGVQVILFFLLQSHILKINIF